MTTTMNDQVAFLFRVSQPEEIRNNSNEILPTLAGVPDDLSFWTELGLKYYSYQFGPPGDGLGEPSARCYGAQPTVLEPPFRAPNALHLVNILRLTVDCPFKDIRQEATVLLEQLSEQGVAVPQVLFSGPSHFILSSDSPQIGEMVMPGLTGDENEACQPNPPPISDSNEINGDQGFGTKINEEEDTQEILRPADKVDHGEGSPEEHGDEMRQSTSVGQELLETIFKHLNLIETAYFGIRFVDNTGQTHWLDPGKKIIKQLEETEPFTLYFGVKFYAADPCKLVEEITRYQFFLQIKQDINQGRLPVPNELATELGAYAVQSEMGDYDPRRHCSGYISEFRFIANQSADLEANIAELHKSMGGQVPAVAELNYLEKVKWLDMYGVDLHPVLGEDNVDYFLGLTPSGVIVLRNKTKVGNYFWPRISKINHKGKYFMLRVRSKSNEEQTYGFETPSKSACKHLWRCSVEHHAFFRLVQVAPSSNANKAHSLNARFRDSARSDTSVRRRTQPQFVRTPSRRYQRRVIEGAQDEGKERIEQITTEALDKGPAIAEPVDKQEPSRAPSIHSYPQRSDSPRSTRSAPWPAPNSAGNKYTGSVPSPKSVRSAGVGSSNNNQSRERDKDRHRHHSRKRSVSAESISSCESRSHRRHRHRGRSRRSSDAESEVSRASGKSHGKRRHHKSGGSSSRRDSGSESENCSHRHKHRHKQRQGSKYELVDSEMQWKEVQKKQAQLAVQQASVVRDLGPTNQAPQASNKGITSTPLRSSGYMNSGLETETEASYHHKRRHRRSHRSKSPDKRLPDELKRHLDFTLIDTEGMSEEQRRQIPYMKIETSQDKVSKSNKIRYNSSIKSTKSSTNEPSPKTSTEKNSTLGPDAKVELMNYGDSPPPPYSPPARGQLPQGNGGKPPLAQKPLISSLSHGLAFEMAATNKQNQIPNSNQVPPRPTSACQFVPPSVPLFKPQIHPQPQAQVYGRSSSRPQHELGLPDPNYPSPSESPDSQKVDSHHENSDSGLGTDHQEYYKSDNFSSLSYTLPLNQVNPSTQSFSGPKDTKPMNGQHSRSDHWNKPSPQRPLHNLNHPSTHTYASNGEEGTALPQQSWFVDKRSGGSGSYIRSGTLERKQRTGHGHQYPPVAYANVNFEYDNFENNCTTGFGERGSRVRSSSLEMILSPLLTSTRTRL